jgi:hypothetical protein
VLIGKEAFQTLDHQEQLLMRVIGLQYQFVLAGDLALIGLVQRMCRVRQLGAIATSFRTLFAALFDEPLGIRNLVAF